MHDPSSSHFHFVAIGPTLALLTDDRQTKLIHHGNSRTLQYKLQCPAILKHCKNTIVQIAYKHTNNVDICFIERQSLTNYTLAQRHKHKHEYSLWGFHDVDFN